MRMPPMIAARPAATERTPPGSRELAESCGTASIKSRSESLGVEPLEHQRLDLMSGGLTVVGDMLERRSSGRRHVMSAVFVVVLIVTVSMRGRQKRDAQRRGEARRELDDAQERVGRAEHERDTAREGEDGLGPDRLMQGT
jgi:hypothetical protein